MSPQYPTKSRRLFSVARESARDLLSKLRENLLAAAALGLIALVLTALRPVREWFGGSSTIPNALLAVLAVTTLGAAAVAARAAFRRLRPQRAFRLPVTDDRLGLQWHIKALPESWISSDLPTLDRHRIDALIDGPFHALGSCYGRVVWKHHYISPVCPFCEEPVPILEVSSKKDGVYQDFPVITMKLIVLLALQRLHNQGKPIGRGLILPDLPYAFPSYQ